MEKFAITKNGRIVERSVSSSYSDVWASAQPKEEIVPIWEFFLWFRENDEKDFFTFYSSQKQIDKAVQEAIDYSDGLFRVVFAIDNPTFGVVARYGKRTEEFIQKSKSC